MEGVFTFKNARSALMLGHARGVALLVAAQRGLAVHEYAPAQVKRAVGAGGADGEGRGGADGRAPSSSSSRRSSAPTPATRWRWRICHLNQATGCALPAKHASAPARAEGGAALLADRLTPVLPAPGGAMIASLNGTGRWRRT